MSEQSKKYSTLGGIDINHDYPVRIPFTYGDMNTGEINAWNECCARAIEMFGLPGGKYTCRITKQHMEFWFLDDKDAMMFKLKWG